MQIRSVDTQAFDSTPLRNLNEVYKHYNLCMVKPENFDDAAQDVAMQELTHD